MYFLGSCLQSVFRTVEKTLYIKKIVFTTFVKHLAISNHRYFSQKICTCPCFFRPLFHSTALKAKSHMLCSKIRYWTPICAPMDCTPTEGWPLLADLGATSGPKRPRLRFHRFRERFWSDFELDFGACWVRFQSNLSYHLWNLIGIPKNLLVEVFPRHFCMFHADSWYSIQASWYSIKGGLSRQASRYSTKASW